MLLTPKGNRYVAAGGGFDPNDHTETWSWYDFSDVSTLYTDTGRTTLVTTNGQNIRGILDKGVAAMHLTSGANGSTWDAANQQMDCSGAANSKFTTDNIVPTGTDQDMEFYATIKTTDDKFMLLASNNNGQFSAVAQDGSGLTPFSGAVSYFPTYYAGATLISPATRQTLYDNWSTGAAVTANHKGVNLQALNTSSLKIVLFDFASGAHEFTGTIKQFVITRALSAPKRTALLDWLATQGAV